MYNHSILYIAFNWTPNAHQKWISSSTYSCFNLATIICVAVHVIRMLHTCSNLPATATIINLFKSYSEIKFDYFIYLLDSFSARLSAPITFFVSKPHIWQKMDMSIQYRFGRSVLSTLQAILTLSGLITVSNRCIYPLLTCAQRLSKYSITIPPLPWWTIYQWITQHLSTLPVVLFCFRSKHDLRVKFYCLPTLEK